MEFYKRKSNMIDKNPPDRMLFNGSSCYTKKFRKFKNKE